MKPSIILDTDTYNEIDDQFAVCYINLAKDKVNLRGFTAVPFFVHSFGTGTGRSTDPDNGMEKSYDEIVKLRKLMRDESVPVYKGSRSFMADPETPVKSEAAEFIIEESKKFPGLTVIGIGAATNIASALLLDDTLADRIKVTWLGSNEYDCDDFKEFNLLQDINAVRALYDSRVPLTQVPCLSVASKLKISVPRLRAYLANCGPLGDYLAEIFEDYVARYDYAENKVIWDIAAVATVINPEAVKTATAPRYAVKEDGDWDRDKILGEMTVVTDLDRETVFEDVFSRIRRNADG